MRSAAGALWVIWRCRQSLSSAWAISTRGWPLGICATVLLLRVMLHSASGFKGAKRAVTLRAVDIVTLQAVGSLQLPDQPSNTKPAAGTARRLTTLPSAKSATQVLPQSRLAGMLTTRPPLGAVTVSRCVGPVTASA